MEYEPDIYIAAKNYTLENIAPYENKYYSYNEYVFYENSNFYSSGDKRHFPEWFTMACYNDEKNTLIFIAFFAYTFTKDDKFIDEKYITDFEGNFQSFIDEYFSEFYDFKA